MPSCALVGLLLASAACGSGTGDGTTQDAGGDSQRGPTITGVTISGPNTLAFSATATLSATVAGTGNFSPIVDWVINVGGGTLSASVGASVQYTAPLVLSPETVQIVAISDADRSKIFAMSISITPAPPVCHPSCSFEICGSGLNRCGVVCMSGTGCAYTGCVAQCICAPQCSQYCNGTNPRACPECMAACEMACYTTHSDCCATYLGHYPGDVCE
jgi:hypothetical protein